jgi:MFS family permease
MTTTNAEAERVRDHDELDSPRAWVMVAGAFWSMFTVFGVLYSFGAFLTPMMVEFRAGHQAVSTMFSIAVLGYFFLGALTGRLTDRFGPRPVLGAGAVAMGAGMILTAFMHQLWLCYLTYGFGVAVGVACGWVPTVAVVGGWFRRRQAAALGLAVSGIGVGTLAVAPLAAWLIELWGWRPTAAGLGGFAAVSLLTCAMVMRRAPSAAATVKLDVGRAIRTPAFAILYLSWLAYAGALFIPFTFLPTYATEHGASATAGAALSGIIGMASVIGRSAFGALASRFGTLRLYRASYLVYGLSFGLWLGARDYRWLVAFALAMGSAYGGVVALSPAVVAQLFGIESLGMMIGVLYTGGGVGVMLGPPIAAFLIDVSGSYTGAILFAIALLALGFGALALLEGYGLTDATLAAKTAIGGDQP